MKRRGFMKAMFAFLGSTAFVSLSYPLIRFLVPHVKKPEAKKLILRKREIPIGEAKNFVINNTPAIVINRRERGFAAFSRVCTHLGCLLEYDKDKKGLLCPCHAGIYDLEGNVVSGPPPKPLVKIPLILEGENIVIG
jgi:cytochrome b6-f complex iron-sulfur subunit